jgi:hypothetical protein
LIFWINLPLGAAALVMTERVLRRLPPPKKAAQVMVLVVGTIIGITIYTPLYCQIVLGLTASSSGLALIAFMGGTVVGSLITARLMVQLTHYMCVPIVGLFLAIAALLVLAHDPAGHSIMSVVLLLFVLGCGLGPMYPMSTILMQNAVKPHQLGTATGTLNFFSHHRCAFRRHRARRRHQRLDDRISGKSRCCARRSGAGLSLGLRGRRRLPGHLLGQSDCGRGTAFARPDERRREIGAMRAPLERFAIVRAANRAGAQFPRSRRDSARAALFR